jgi:hypothetical protein
LNGGSGSDTAIFLLFDLFGVPAPTGSNWTVTDPLTGGKYKGSSIENAVVPPTPL